MKVLATLRRSRLVGVLVVLGLLVVWQVVASAHQPSATFPPLSDVLRRGRELISDGTVPTRICQTLSVMARGYALGSAAGIVIGLAMGYSRFVWAALEPLVELLRPIPIAAVVPLLILFLGIDDGLKIVSIAVSTFFPVLINTYSGVRSVPPTLHDTARTFSLATAPTLREIVIRHATPQILVGMRMALSISLVVAVFTEMVSGSSGMGWFIVNAQQTLTITDIYVGALVLAVVGYALNALFLVVERLLIPWHESQRHRGHAR